MDRMGVAGLMHRLLWTVALLALAACAPLSLEPTTEAGGGAPVAEQGQPITGDVDETASRLPTIESEAVMRYEELKLSDGTLIEYAMVLPPNYDVSLEYPILLALPPGAQTRSMVDFGLDNFWASGAIANGWIVLSPVAPGGQLFFNGSEHFVPEFLAETAKLYPPEGGKVHIGGISNGGISSFRIAGENSQLFHSLLALPGFPQTDDDRANLDTLASMPVAMFVGANDNSWIGPMQTAADRLTAQGGDVLFEIIAGEDHVIETLAGGDRLFELLESYS